MRRLALALLFAAYAPAALATSQGYMVMRNWQVMDKCAKEAQTAFPDFTADANAKRDARLQQCLEGKNLPPRAPVAAPQR
ncbi:MAG TPA: hypothetical protein VJR70_05125 [Stellaceae bacterium]|nr:hypothetical protein [Stellaceae bacterium]